MFLFRETGRICVVGRKNHQEMSKSQALINLVTGILLLVSMKAAQAQEMQELSKDSISCLVKKYYHFNEKVFQANSTLEDIDHVFALFSDDFIYVHPKYGGEYSREMLYNGYIRNQKNGAYNGSVVDIKIVNMIVGLNAIVVEKQFVTKKEGKLKEGNPEMTLFEFRDNKISKILEYW